MIEFAVILLFTIILLLCIAAGKSILYALIFGFFLFSAYAFYRKHNLRKILIMAFSGVKTVKNILVTFILIGMITAIWRQSGTIPYIVYHSVRLCSPQIMVLAAFLLCSLLSFLTGTAFGTAATIGVICAAISDSMGISPVLYGGAILSGSFFGDRCSPMSTSALLVSSLTDTDIFRNIKEMMRTCMVPFITTCIIYYLAGNTTDVSAGTDQVQDIFAQHFILTPLLLIPAAVIVILSLFRINVKITMAVSILCGMILSAFIQHTDIFDILQTAIYGYRPSDEALYSLLNGGGILSMKNVFLIVCISSSYSGIFKGTGLLDRIKNSLYRLSESITPYGSVLFTSILTSMIACNQTLSIMLTYQLCGDTEKDNYRMASYLENTAVVIAPLIPWSIAGAVPLASVHAPAAAILTACYLYLLPVWNYITNRRLS